MERRESPAVAACRSELAQRWLDPETHYRLGIALMEAGLADEAIGSFRTALAQREMFPEAWCELGRALLAIGQRSEAVEALRKALEQNPTLARAYYYLGNARREAGLWDEAVASFGMASILQPDSAEAHYNLGMAHSARGDFAQAIEAYSAALTLRPLYADALNNLGNCLAQLGKLDEAEASFRKALVVRPKSPDIHSNLGNALRDMAKLDESIACYGRASGLQPDCELWDSHRLYALHFKPGVEPEALLDEHLEWDRRHGQPLAKCIRPHENDRTPDRRLRIGYVSADFREHVVGRNILPLLRGHDRAQFEVFCYYNFGKEDELTARFRGYADGWRTIAGVGDERVAERIREDRIDILVDLSLHMAGNRMAVFARKPAPVQVTFAGYPSGTGLRAMDYRLTDAYLDPVGVSDRFYREESIRLPGSFWCFDPTGREPEVGPLPAAERGGRVTFGCFNNFCKVNEPVVRLWSAVLRAVGGSRLLLLAPRGASRERVLGVFGEEGIVRERIEFVDRQAREGYLRMYEHVDVALDTFPYNGHTTTLEGMWMGVPVISRVGRLAVSRAGVSQLTNIGLGELAGETDEEFVRIAKVLAGDVAQLEGIRVGLRDRMRSSALTDVKGFVAGIENAYRDIWVRWCGS
jgi:predicted O-linked N-acetylglucosamine transferase (SPINDLY family)